MVNMLLNAAFCENLYRDLTKHEPTEENIAVCSMLIRDSKELKANVEDILAIAWVESWFTAQLKPTRYNCVGPLQIKVQYWCEGKKLSTCDPFHDGVKAIKYYIKKFKPINKAYCYYNNSKKKKCKAKYGYKTEYVKDVLSAKIKIKKLMKNKSFRNMFKN